MRATTPTRASIGSLKRIPAGVFRVGSRFHAREFPARQMQSAEFQIAQTPVTVIQFAAFVESDADREQRWWSPEGWEWVNGRADGWGRKDRRIPDGWELQLKHETHPVTGVTLFEAQAYCAWLSVAKNKKVRLPTEVEWEYAARGEDGRPFPWGEEFDARLANTAESDLTTTMEAAGNPADSSPFGVMDMCGNVQQWTSSAYVALKEERVPPGPLFVTRGGSFNDTAFGARTSYRRGYPPGFFYPFLGFRVVVEAV